MPSHHHDPGLAGPGGRGPAGDPSRRRHAHPAGAGAQHVNDGAKATLPAGADGRTLVLADAARSGWRATLDGHALAPLLVDGWAQGFMVPADGGRLVLRYDSGRRDGWLAVQLIVLMLVLVLAAPSVRAEDGLDLETVDEAEPEPVDLDSLVDRDTLPVEDDEPARSTSPSRSRSCGARAGGRGVEPEPDGRGSSSRCR